MRAQSVSVPHSLNTKMGVPQQEANMSPEELNRMMLAKEFLSTEKVYVESMQIAVNDYCQELQKKVEEFPPEKKPCDVKDIFLNLGEVLEYHKRLLKELEKCIDSPNKPWDMNNHFCRIFLTIVCPTNTHNHWTILRSGFAL